MSSIYSPFGTDDYDYFSSDGKERPTFKRTKFGLKVPIVPSPESDFSSNNDLKLVKKQQESPKQDESPKIEADSYSLRAENVFSTYETLEFDAQNLFKVFKENKSTVIPDLQTSLTKTANYLSDLQNIQIPQSVRPLKNHTKSIINKSESNINIISNNTPRLSKDITNFDTKINQFMRDFNDTENRIVTDFQIIRKQQQKNATNMQKTEERISKSTSKFYPLISVLKDTNNKYSLTDSMATNTFKTMNEEVNLVIADSIVDLNSAIKECSKIRNEKSLVLYSKTKNMSLKASESLVNVNRNIQESTLTFSSDIKSAYRSISAGINNFSQEAEENVQKIDQRIDNAYKETVEEENTIQNSIIDIISNFKKVQEDDNQEFTEKITNEIKNRAETREKFNKKVEEFNSNTDKKLLSEMEKVKDWTVATEEDLKGRREVFIKEFDELMPGLRNNNTRLSDVEKRIQDVEKSFQEAQKYVLSEITTSKNALNAAFQEFSLLSTIINTNMNDLLSRTNKLVLKTNDEDYVNHESIYNYVQKLENYADAVYTSLESQLGMLKVCVSEGIENVDVSYIRTEECTIPEKPVPNFERIKAMPISTKTTKENPESEKDESITDEYSSTTLDDSDKEDSIHIE